MLVSVVTATYNSEQTILRTLQSVNNQTYKDIEHVVVDGESYDSTKDIVDAFDSNRLSFFSEKDDGIYDALNKGVLMSKGDAILILNSDDWLEPDAIERLVITLENEGVDFTFGSVKYLDGEYERILSPVTDYQDKNIQRMPFPHISLLIKRCVYNDLNNYSTDYKIAGDFDFIIRMIRAGYQGKDSKVLIGCALSGGVSASTLSIFESYRIVVKHGKPKFLAVMKLWEYVLKFIILRILPLSIKYKLIKIINSFKFLIRRF
jgi:glycosyltransferase involved in cell wall biosynthesis